MSWKFSGALLSVFLLAVLVVGGHRMMRLYNPSAVKAEKKTQLYLHGPTSLDELSHVLHDSLHVVDDPSELKWAARIYGWKSFQTGHYTIDGGQTYNDFLSKLGRGNQDPISFTIVPGRRQRVITNFLAHRMKFDSLSLAQTLADSSFLREERISPNTLVGYFYPATYELYWTASPRKTLQLLFNQFNRQVKEGLASQIKASGLSLAQVLALASIIEGEAIHADEKPTISGLYWNRLNSGMRLQADPTVNYAVGEQRRLYFRDYKTEHPYNTYVIDGLPPGPINNPSIGSIKAALNPKEHDYLYMVAQPNGYHGFSKTYAEHQRKSEEWRQYLKSRSK